MGGNQGGLREGVPLESEGERGPCDYLELADARGEGANTTWIGEAERAFRDSRREFKKVKKEVEDKGRTVYEKPGGKTWGSDLAERSEKGMEAREVMSIEEEGNDSGNSLSGKAKAMTTK